MIRNRKHARRGVAPLEFALCLFVLLPLFFCMLWLGIYINGTSAATVEARALAWHERHDGGASQVLRFDDTDQGRIEKSATKDVLDRPVAAVVDDPSSSHLVFGGSWDYRQADKHDRTDLNKQPNWDLCFELSGRTVTGLANAFGNFDPAALLPADFTSGRLTELEGESAGADQKFDQLKEQKRQELRAKMAQRKPEIDRLSTDPKVRKWADLELRIRTIQVEKWDVTGTVVAGLKGEQRMLQLNQQQLQQAQRLAELLKKEVADQRALGALQ